MAPKLKTIHITVTEDLYQKIQQYGLMNNINNTFANDMEGHIADLEEGR